MDRQRPAQAAHLSIYGPEAAQLKRVASLAPLASLSSIARRALAAGLPLVEAELRDAARALAQEER